MTALAHDLHDQWIADRDVTADAAAQIARFVREGGDLHELLGRLCETAPRPVIRAVTDMEADRQPVVRRFRPNASPVAGMVAAYDELDAS